MMQMLEAAGVPILDDGQREEDDSNPNGYYELEAVKATAHDGTPSKSFTRCCRTFPRIITTKFSSCNETCTK